MERKKKITRWCKSKKDALEFCKLLTEKYKCTDVELKNASMLGLLEDTQYEFKFFSPLRRMDLPADTINRYLDYEETQPYIDTLSSALSKLNGAELYAVSRAITPHNVACWKKSELIETVLDSQRRILYNGTKGFDVKHWDDEDDDHGTKYYADKSCV